VIPTKFCLIVKTGSTNCELRSGAKSAVYDFLVIDRVAGAINTFGSVRVSVRLTVGTLLFEPFDI